MTICLAVVCQLRISKFQFIIGHPICSSPITQSHSLQSSQTEIINRFPCWVIVRRARDLDQPAIVPDRRETTAGGSVVRPTACLPLGRSALSLHRSGVKTVSPRAPATAPGFRRAFRGRSGPAGPLAGYRLRPYNSNMYDRSADTSEQVGCGRLLQIQRTWGLDD